MDRRSFLKLGAQLSAAGALGAGAVDRLAGEAHALETRRALHSTSVLDGAPANSGVDTVVIVMMENRSFDSYLGWLAGEHRYLDRGRSRYGSEFRLLGNQHASYLDAQGNRVQTGYHTETAGPIDDYHGCGHPDPGHGWGAGRAERDLGFLASDSGNDRFALSYFRGRDLPIYRELAYRFTVCDRWHASLLGPTFPNREYLMSAQSGGHKDNYQPWAEGGFQWDAIFDRLHAAGVSVGDYASDFAPFLLFGGRAVPFIHTLDDFHSDAAAGRLPHVTFVDPSFLGAGENDDHPLADPRAGQKFIRDVFRAFVRSPQWQRGLFIVTYDEWGGFFDTVRPPMMSDDRASSNDQENFGQAGFRVPGIVASPRALPGFVDHAQYDHTSVLRFLEWRFLGAPAHGNASTSASPWWLTSRDRNARNLGRTLSANVFDPDLHFDIDMPLAEPTPMCDGSSGGFARVDGRHPFAELAESGYLARIGYRKPLPA